MKRGLIAREIPLEVFEQRLSHVRAALTERDLTALVVYSDVWRSNQGRFLTNFMPYWNRSLIVIPRHAPPVLLCALSPRVYPWIKSVTIFEEIRPASKLMATLDQLCTERGWSKVGVLDFPKLPVEIHAGLADREIVDVPSAGLVVSDDAELAMRRKAAAIARQILAQHLSTAAGAIDHHFVGRLECDYRCAGAEDLVIRLSSRGSTPAPAKGEMLRDAYSVAIALEYCGHWVKVTRAHAPPGETAALEELFRASLTAGDGYRQKLAGPQPYEPGSGAIFALHVDHAGLYYGDTCSGVETL